jgi:pSer/pThr/pTyr-binding forkhead associated (FHA) protein
MISSEAEFESTPAAEVPAIAPPAAVPSSDDFPDFPDMPDIPEVPAVPPTMPAMPIPQPTYPTAASTGSSSTQLQLQSARLLHVQTDSVIELPQNLSVIHIGKPNDRVPPDVDVAGFPNSEIVSRIHADIRVEGDLYYLEDVGSSNGTYVNNAPLPVGNRHRLRAGDRIALGKGDQVTFIFQIF